MGSLMRPLLLILESSSICGGLAGDQRIERAVYRCWPEGGVSTLIAHYSLWISLWGLWSGLRCYYYLDKPSSATSPLQQIPPWILESLGERKSEQKPSLTSKEIHWLFAWFPFFSTKTAHLEEYAETSQLILYAWMNHYYGGIYS